MRENSYHLERISRSSSTPAVQRIDVGLLRAGYGRGISTAPTAYATAADEVSKSARLWTIV